MAKVETTAKLLINISLFNLKVALIADQSKTFGITPDRIDQSMWKQTIIKPINNATYWLIAVVKPAPVLAQPQRIINK